MSLQSLYWGEPLWLLVLLQPLVMLLLGRLQNRKQLARYANPVLHAWVVSATHDNWRQRLVNRNTAYFAAWVCIAIAAAGPRLADEIPGHSDNPGIDIMAVIDISRSMHVQDITPGRLGRAKQELLSLSSQLQQDRLGLVVYAARAHQYMPLTHDKTVMRHFLNNLDNLSPPTQGSRPAEALRLAEKLLQKQDPDNKRSKAILLLTDGENLQPPVKVNTPVFVLGTGTVEGDAIPGYKGDWLRKDGQLLVSRLQEPTLKNVAEQSGGHYSRAYRDNSDWDALYTKGIKRIKQAKGLVNPDTVIWHELYAYALVPGLILLIMSTLSLKTSGARRTSSIQVSTLVVLLFSAALISVPEAQASDNTSAYHSFLKNDYLSSLEQYQSIEGFYGRFGEGASAYRLKDSAHAISAFRQAFLYAQDDAQRATALYNLGNSHFQDGNYPAAISSYRDALIYNPRDLSSQRNLAFSQKLNSTVQKRLQRLQNLLQPGRGPKQASAATNTEIGDDSSVSVDESNDELEQNTNTEIDYTDTLSEALILKGIEHAQLADNALTGTTSIHHNNETNSLAITRFQLDLISDNQVLFWNRILEIEEGFSAPQAKPSQIKGVEAW